MELVKRLEEKRKKPKLRETRLGIFSFICALLSLAYMNVYLITLGGLDGLSNFFFQFTPTIGVVLALVSFTRFNYKKTFTWWALGLFLFMLVCVFVIGFFEFTIYPKP
ncbi:hypothetical protein GCM10008986_34970 [Salinibacillus aidingensis]|uniref:Uncharacterized protein n=1 Tax=Salinibacillus aidingensis TaxID=237684 RepID=A0ABN1BS73_9BACI